MFRERHFGMGLISPAYVPKAVAHTLIPQGLYGEGGAEAAARGQRSRDPDLR